MAARRPDELFRGFLLELMEARYGSCWTVFCTQFRQKDWHARLGGGVHADVIMDRIVHGTAWVGMGKFNMRRKLGAGGSGASAYLAPLGEGRRYRLSMPPVSGHDNAGRSNAQILMLHAEKSSPTLLLPPDVISERYTHHHLNRGATVEPIYSMTTLQHNPSQVKSAARDDVARVTEQGTGAYVFFGEEVFEERVAKEREDAAYEARLIGSVGRGVADIQTGCYVTSLDEAFERAAVLRGKRAEHRASHRR